MMASEPTDPVGASEPTDPARASEPTDMENLAALYRSHRLLTQKDWYEPPALESTTIAAISACRRSCACWSCFIILRGSPNGFTRPPSRA